MSRALSLGFKIISGLLAFEIVDIDKRRYNFIVCSYSMCFISYSGICDEAGIIDRVILLPYQDASPRVSLHYILCRLLMDNLQYWARISIK